MGGGGGFIKNIGYIIVGAIGVGFIVGTVILLAILATKI